MSRVVVTAARPDRNAAQGLGGEWPDFDLVLPSHGGTPLRASSLLQGRFRRRLKRGGLARHFTLYSLRYTHATLQLLAGERDKVVSDLIGHESVNFTKDIYKRVLPVMQGRASTARKAALRVRFAQRPRERRRACRGNSLTAHAYSLTASLNRD